LASGWVLVRWSGSQVRSATFPPSFFFCLARLLRTASMAVVSGHLELAGADLLPRGVVEVEQAEVVVDPADGLAGLASDLGLGVAAVDQGAERFGALHGVQFAPLAVLHEQRRAG
jgi:hypothetical protein